MILTSMSDDEIRDIENQVYDIAYDYQLSDNVMISVNIKMQIIIIIGLEYFLIMIM